VVRGPSVNLFEASVDGIEVLQGKRFEALLGQEVVVGEDEDVNIEHDVQVEGIRIVLELRLDLLVLLKLLLKDIMDVLYQSSFWHHYYFLAVEVD